jgi:hypothetical protein
LLSVACDPACWLARAHSKSGDFYLPTTGQPLQAHDLEVDSDRLAAEEWIIDQADKVCVCRVWCSICRLGRACSVGLRLLIFSRGLCFAG